MLKAHAAVYDVWLGGQAPFQIDDPRFSGKARATRTFAAGRAVGPIAVNCGLAGWPGRPPALIGADRETL